MVVEVTVLKPIDYVDLEERVRTYVRVRTVAPVDVYHVYTVHIYSAYIISTTRVQLDCVTLHYMPD